ncbi:hypothetical protein [Megasphaera sueciensis]|uniref:hypothetical protein n=1 Tax=Megasphaera sueciensis TaxID=349094 RepID=UPI003D05068B
MKNYVKEWMNDEKIKNNEIFRIKENKGIYSIPNDDNLYNVDANYPNGREDRLLIKLLKGEAKVITKNDKIKDHFKEIFKLLPDDSDFYSNICISSVVENVNCPYRGKTADCKKCWFETVGMEDKP